MRPWAGDCGVRLSLAFVNQLALLCARALCSDFSDAMPEWFLQSRVSNGSSFISPLPL